MRQNSKKNDKKISFCLFSIENLAVYLLPVGRLWGCFLGGSEVWSGEVWHAEIAVKVKMSEKTRCGF